MWCTILHTRHRLSTVIWVVLGLEASLSAGAKFADIDSILAAVLAFSIGVLFLGTEAGIADVLNELVCQV